MIAPKNTQPKGTAAPRLLDVLREVLREAYSLPTEAVHQLDAALCAFTIIVPQLASARYCHRVSALLSVAANDIDVIDRPLWPMCRCQGIKNERPLTIRLRPSLFWYFG